MLLEFRTKIQKIYLRPERANSK